MAKTRYSALQNPWETPSDDSYVSVLHEDVPEQTLIFADQMRNGRIRADVTPLKGSPSPRRGTEGKEGAILFRYQGAGRYYYAGIGGFGSKFYVAKVLPGPVYLPLGEAGVRDSLDYGQTYHLTVECLGNQISLYENDVLQVRTFDESYRMGQWGLMSWRTSVRFEDVRFEASTPVCFVVMPFAEELDYVYDVIKTTVQSYDLECVRADEIMVSSPVMEDVKQQIAEADLIVVDFTGKNPNVYYEAGLADAWGKKAIVLAQSADDLTFDVRHIRTILYSNTMGADVRLRQNLGQAIAETLGLRPSVAR